MNVNLPENKKLNKKAIIIYIIAAIICILAIVVVVESQVLGNDFVNGLFGVSKLTKRSEQEEINLKTNFENIFDNTFESGENNRLVYTNYQRKENINNSEIDVSLPYINIENEEIKKFNKEISETFEKKTEEVLNKNLENTIYTVKYKAVIENNILSVAIYSDLKQEKSAQRVIVQTLNYDLNQDKIIDLKDAVSTYNLSSSYVQNKINKAIQEEEKNAEAFKEMGYNVFLRELDSDIYKIENITEFFIYENNIYVIFAYGNKDITSEIDIVII